MNSCNDSGSNELMDTVVMTSTAAMTTTQSGNHHLHHHHHHNHHQFYQQSSRLPAAAAAAAIVVAGNVDDINNEHSIVNDDDDDDNDDVENNIDDNDNDNVNIGNEFNHHTNNELTGGGGVGGGGGLGLSLCNIGNLPSAVKQQQQHPMQLKQQMLSQSTPQQEQEHYVWEMRARSPNVTPVSTVLNSPDLNTDSTMQYGLHHSRHMHHSTHQYHQQHQRQQQHHHHHHHHQIRVGHSPGSQFEQHDILPQCLASPGSPTDMGKGDGQCLHDGEIVVFDDIDTNWMNKTSANNLNNKEAVALQTATAAAAASAGGRLDISSEATSVPLYQQQQQKNLYPNSSEDILKVTKMIGQLPIAEYEGSPRRFGNQNSQITTINSTKMGSGNSNHQPQQQQAMNFPKRPPGFPLRVSPSASQQRYTSNTQSLGASATTTITTTSTNTTDGGYINNNCNDNNAIKSVGNLIDLIDHHDHELEQKSSILMQRQTSMVASGAPPTVGTPTFDYLYEFSETRKVLEEFFKANPDDEKRFTDFTESGDDVASSVVSQDTQQDYIDEEKHMEQAYIGQRLARIPKDELYMVHRSPKKQQATAAATTTTTAAAAASNNNLSNLVSVNVNLNSAYNNEHNDIELYIDSNSRSSGELADAELEVNLRRHSRNFTLSPETTDYDSNCGDLDSLSNDINCPTDYGKLYTSMPVLEDGLSSGHASDTENNVSVVCDKQQQQVTHQNQEFNGNNEKQQQAAATTTTLSENEYNASFSMPEGSIPNGDSISDFVVSKMNEQDLQNDLSDESCRNTHQIEMNRYSPIYATVGSAMASSANAAVAAAAVVLKQSSPQSVAPALIHNHSLRNTAAGAATQTNQHRTAESIEIQEAMKEIRSALQRAKTQPEKLKFCDEVLPADPDSPVWVPRKNTTITALIASSSSSSSLIGTNTATSTGTGMGSGTGTNNHISLSRLHSSGCTNGASIGDEEEPDTDLETDRLLGQQRLDEHDFFDEKSGWQKATRSGVVIDACEQTSDATPPNVILSTDFDNSNNSGISNCGGSANNNINNNTNSTGCSSGILKPPNYSSATIRQGIGTSLTPHNSPDICEIVGGNNTIAGGCASLTSPEKLQYSKSPTGSLKSLKDSTNNEKKVKTRNKEGLLEPEVLIEGVLFRARYLGSTQLVCEGQPTKSTRMMQAEEAVSRIKAPEGESQPSTEVDLFISTEKIMVLNTDLKEIMMDHALRTISYIADIGDLVVLMARRRFVPSGTTTTTTTITADSCLSEIENTINNGSSSCSGGGGGNGGNKDNNKEQTGSGGSTKHNRTPKMICHVFESDEAQFIAQSIGQAFQVAYMEFLKANGIENESLAKEMDYQEVLNSQEIFGDELEIFAKKELQKEVVVPKGKGEILGVVIVESGWGSMLPTVVIANLMSGGAAARCGQLNIGDQLIAINGMSLVGLPLSTCQSYIRNAKNQTAVKFTVVPCPPVVEVKILRPKALFQLGFSVQNGVICSLLRGGIAERGGVRVGHRIIEINNQSVVAVPHDTIVKLLSSSVGEILMKTMPTSMFRLLTGQETPIYI